MIKNNSAAISNLQTLPPPPPTFRPCRRQLQNPVAAAPPESAVATAPLEPAVAAIFIPPHLASISKRRGRTPLPVATTQTP
jgi:hypothetical protein